MRTSITIIGLSFISNAMALDYDKKNSIKVGMNIFYRDYREVLVLPKKSNENGILSGLILGYEHKAPDSLMFGLDFQWVLGDTRYDGALQDMYGDYVAPWESKTTNIFINLDTQIGYTISKTHRHLFTPFFGIGTSSWGRGIDSYAELYTWSYFIVGLQYDYNVSNQYQYGLSIKIMPMIDGTMKAEGVSSSVMTLGRKTHFEVSAPIIYKNTPQSRRYWCFTPYYQYQSFGESNMVSVDYNPYVYAYEPASHTHIVGIKAEYNFSF